MNYELNKVIGENETGFKGTNNTHYRMEAWQFILAGGGLFNNLDYSFVAGHERGDFVYPKNQPGGGNADYRRQLRILSRFINRFDFIKMRPDNAIVRGGLPPKAKAYALIEPGKQYAVYLFGGPQANLEMELPSGKYTLEWLDPIAGRTQDPRTLEHGGGIARLASPNFTEDAALRLVRAK